MNTPDMTSQGQVTPSALGNGSPLCLSCDRVPAALCNEDGAYCVDCMKFHLLEKMFVQLTKLNHFHEI